MRTADQLRKALRDCITYPELIAAADDIATWPQYARKRLEEINRTAIGTLDEPRTTPTTGHILTFQPTDEGNAPITVHGWTLCNAAARLLSELYEQHERHNAEPIDETLAAEFFEGLAEIARSYAPEHRYTRRDFSDPESNFDIIYTQEAINTPDSIAPRTN